MKRYTLLLSAFLFFSVNGIYAQDAAKQLMERIALPNGWSLTPAGKTLKAGDLPLNIAISPSGKYAALTNNGQSDQSIMMIDIENELVCDSVTIGKAWLGLAFSADGSRLYASGGNDNMIIRYRVSNGHLAVEDSLILGNPWPEKISVAGIALDDKADRLYAVTKENNSLYVLDTRNKRVLSQHPLGGEGYTCLLSPDRKTLYASCWGCDRVLAFNTTDMTLRGSVSTGDNPNDMCLTANGRYLFIANANDNSVSVIDTRKLRVLETLNAALYPGSPAGSTSNSLALSRDGKTLYIANADNNCITVFDVSKPGNGRGTGFIPTGWYPTCVRVTGDKILVSNGKGLSSMANPRGPDPYNDDEEVVYQEGGRTVRAKVQYIGGLLKGTLSIIGKPDPATLNVWSKAVLQNAPYSKERELLSEVPAGNPVPSKVGDKSPIKHIFYVIKENRTYDQVLGDMPEGNGDPTLVLFGERVTPNQHAIAREFVLLDNFYVNGEVSADGHSWTMGAYATDYLEKNWPTSYGGRGGSYPGEGERAVANNKAFLWDNCRKNGVSYRSYGEFIGENGPNISSLENHYCKAYTLWDQRVRDTVRFREWKRDFDSLLAAGSVPQLNTVRFINDHTEGLSHGRPSPFAHVADNDLAVGMFVDYLSHSPVWNESLILIVEDDAQNGPDHVDAHRSTAYIAGGYVKEGSVDHTVYTTASLLRTIELILGIPPMTQYDASAVPLWNCMNNTAGHRPFTVRPCLIDLDEKNTAENTWQKKSERFDFTAEDRVNDSEFNEVIWKAVKGLDSPCPPAVRAAFFIPAGGEEDDD